MYRTTSLILLLAAPTVFAACTPRQSATPAATAETLPDKAAVRQWLGSDKVSFNGWWRIGAANKKTRGFQAYQRIEFVPGQYYEHSAISVQDELPADITESTSRTEWNSAGGVQRLLCSQPGLKTVVENRDGKWLVSLTKNGTITTDSLPTLEDAISHAEETGGREILFLKDRQTTLLGDKMPLTDQFEITSTTRQWNGKEVKAWQAKAEKLTLFFSTADGTLLAAEAGEFRMERVQEEVIQEVRRKAAELQRQAETQPVPLDKLPPAEPVIRAKIVLPKSSVPIPSDSLQTVKVEQDTLIITRDSNWDSTVPADVALSEFVKPEAALAESEAFQQLSKAVKSQASHSDATNLLATAAVRLSDIVAWLPTEQKETPAEALTKKQAGPLAWTRLLVALCRAAGTPAREVHGFLISPDTKSTQRRVWVEVLNEGDWLAFDPRLAPAPSDDGEYALETLLENGCEGYVPAPVMSLHLTVCRGLPDAATEAYLQSAPAVLRCTVTRGNALGEEEADPAAPFIPVPLPGKGEGSPHTRKSRAASPSGRTP